MGQLGTEKKVEETEYESESEESVFALATRRRNASDDDDDGDGEGEARDMLVRSNRRAGIGYPEESNCLGGYDDKDAVSYIGVFEEVGDERVGVLEVEEEEKDFKENECEKRSSKTEFQVELKQRKEENESELPVYPKNVAFYMHDDRFRGRGRGKSRLTLDERFRSLKDEQKWKHDKFEEMEMQEVRRISGQCHQGHYKNQGKFHGYVKAETNGNVNNQNYSSKVVRGRGPIKYKPTMRSGNVNPSTKNRQSKKPEDKPLNTKPKRKSSTKDEQTGKLVEMTSNSDSVGSNSLASEKHMFVKNMSHISQMFKSSSHNSVKLIKDVKDGKSFRYFPTSVLPNDYIFVPQCSPLLQGENNANPIGPDMLYVENLICAASANYLTNLPIQSSINWQTYTIGTQMMGQRDLSLSTALVHQLSLTSSQVISEYILLQQPIVEQMPVETTTQHPSQVFPVQLGPCSLSGSQALSEATLPISYEPQILGLPHISSRSKVELGGKGTNTLHRNGRGSVLSCETQCDQNLTGTAAVFPGGGTSTFSWYSKLVEYRGAVRDAMQQGSQHSGSFGDPAVNMAFAGNISQLQNISRSPEIIWLPVLPPAAGIVGSAYHSSYIAADGVDHNAHSTTESSSHRVTGYSKTKVKETK